MVIVSFGAIKKMSLKHNEVHRMALDLSDEFFRTWNRKTLKDP